MSDYENEGVEIEIIVQYKSNGLRKQKFIVDAWMAEYILNEEITLKDMYGGIDRKSSKTPTTGFRYTLKYRKHPIDRVVVPVTELNFRGEGIFSVTKLITGISKLHRKEGVSDNDFRVSSFELPEDYALPFSINKKYRLWKEKQEEITS